MFVAVGVVPLGKPSRKGARGKSDGTLFRSINTGILSGLHKRLVQHTEVASFVSLENSVLKEPPSFLHWFHALSLKPTVWKVKQEVRPFVPGQT